MSAHSAELPIVDLHSHLVPGVDDGARSVDAVLEGVGRMAERGVRTIGTTPHLDGSLTRNSSLLEDFLSRVDEAFEEARRAVDERYPEIGFFRGHEVAPGVTRPDLSDARIRLGDSDAVLVEWPWLRIPRRTPSILRGLRSQGVRPLIAHPERYRGYRSDLELPGEWRAEGAFLQVTFGSLAGRYGPRALSVAAHLLRRGWADCLATDFHARPQLRLYIRAAREEFQRLGAEEAWQLLTSTNPGRISGGEEPLPVPPFEWDGSGHRPARSPDER